LPTSPSLLDRYRGALIGLAVGDALGATMEFTRRGERPPMTDMVGGGAHGLLAGEWTDDTSMALCLAASLIEREGFDPLDQMRRYARWMGEGYMTPAGRCIDMGGTVSRAMARFRDTMDPNAGSTDPDSAGNGSLMRLAPVPLFYHPDRKAVRHWSMDSSRTTHAASECLEACRLFGTMIDAALGGGSREEILGIGRDDSHGCPRIHSIARGDYREKQIDDIRTSGYVVHTLEAALWCFSRAEDFRSGALEAANLADDADTTAAVFGQLAGAHWGESAIPANWRNLLARRADIRQMADLLYHLGNAST